MSENTRREVLRGLVGVTGGSGVLAGCLDRERIDLRVANEDGAGHRLSIVVVPNGGSRFTADIQLGAGRTFERTDVLPPAGQGRPYETTVQVRGGTTARRAVAVDGMRAIRVVVRGPSDVQIGADTGSQ